MQQAQDLERDSKKEESFSEDEDNESKMETTTHPSGLSTQVSDDLKALQGSCTHPSLLEIHTITRLQHHYLLQRL